MARAEKPMTLQRRRDTDEATSSAVMVAVRGEMFETPRLAESGEHLGANLLDIGRGGLCRSGGRGGRDGAPRAASVFRLRTQRSHPVLKARLTRAWACEEAGSFIAELATGGGRASSHVLAWWGFCREAQSSVCGVLCPAIER